MIKKAINYIKIIIAAIIKMLPAIVFTVILVLVFLVSPIITQSIQHAAKWICELEATTITRFVELVLGISLTAVIALPVRLFIKSIDK